MVASEKNNTTALKNALNCHEVIFYKHFEKARKSTNELLNLQDIECKSPSLHSKTRYVGCACFVLMMQLF